MKDRQSIATTKFSVRESGNQKYIEGYFIIFNQYTKLWDGFYERISPEAVKDMSDVVALFNHNHNLILGSTRNKTLTLSKDSHGVKGIIRVNQNDRDAMNAYERISRGDIKGCSFGFDLVKESVIKDADGSYRSTVKELKLYEVSPCTFPAYPQTTINARKNDLKANARLANPAVPKDRRTRQRMLIQKLKGM